MTEIAGRGDSDRPSPEDAGADRRAVGALVLAAGSGSRMGRAKQYLEISTGVRIVDRTIAAVADLAAWTGVVLPPEDRWTGAAVDAVVDGGSSRHESLANGLRAIPTEIEIVVVHSASHPLASPALAASLVDAVAAGADAAVPFLAVVDVVKRRSDTGTLTTVGRETLGTAQCPMAFARPILDRAFAEAEPGIEESALVEAIGGTVVAVDGEVTNLHVVDPASLSAARALAELTAPRPDASAPARGDAARGDDPSRVGS